MFLKLLNIAINHQWLTSSQHFCSLSLSSSTDCMDFRNKFTHSFTYQNLGEYIFSLGLNTLKF